jgi:ribonuclease P protein component
MLAQKNRLRKAIDFALASKGMRVSGENFLLYIATPAKGECDGAPVKVGLIVGKNVGGSVVRHRVSRQLRHAIVPHLHQFPSGTLLVVRAHPSAAQSTETNLAGEVSKLIEKYLSRRTTAAQ